MPILPSPCEVSLAFLSGTGWGVVVGNGVIGETGANGRTIDCEADCKYSGYPLPQCTRPYPLLGPKGNHYDEEGRLMYCAAYYDTFAKPPNGQGQGHPGTKVSYT